MSPCIVDTRNRKEDLRSCYQLGRLRCSARCVMRVSYGRIIPLLFLFFFILFRTSLFLFADPLAVVVGRPVHHDIAFESEYLGIVCRVLNR